ncbi:hypothetical protein [Aporhodopirellula aestuarii]|uniref:Uncharacterized protein n=1 Tax=Aporhodopirellula aestuarii TaxID=2950107 RepID=A0ABT0UA66_9BACT|nr:hypothetical protein [Aporhodopirellula aestuarii]MCM2373671.1 hypothetical protein [Aporhodopirellula aestuarii]
MSATSAPSSVYHIAAHPLTTLRRWIHRLALLIDQSDRQMLRAGVVVPRCERATIISTKPKI